MSTAVRARVTMSAASNSRSASSPVGLGTSVDMPVMTPPTTWASPHFYLGAGVADGLTPCLDSGCFGAGVGADQHEPVTHRRDNVVCPIPCGCHSTDDSYTPGPSQRPAAVNADRPIPSTVIYLAERRQHFPALGLRCWSGLR